jgi:hypothetical protein|tara:strand:+ start:275 stop:412 length:138 start_codon:yes stop_codon:yes gene_type:complete
MTSSKGLKSNPVAKELRTKKFRSQKVPNKKKELEKKRIKKYDNCN